MMPELDGLAHRVVAALCNGVYQGVLLTLVVALALRYLRRANAATRYVLELIAPAIVAALPLVHFLAGGRSTAVGRELAIATAAGPVSHGPALTPALSRPTGEGAPATAGAGEGGFRAGEQVRKEPGASRGRGPAGQTRQTDQARQVGCLSQTGQDCRAVEKIPCGGASRDAEGSHGERARGKGACGLQATHPSDGGQGRYSAIGD